MIILHQNETVVFAESVFMLTGFGHKEQAFITENLPFFKACRSDVLIAGFGKNEDADLDALRYEHLPFPAELSVDAIREKILPRVREIFSGLGRLDEDGEPDTTLFFAKGGKAYVLEPDGSVGPIEGEASYGMEQAMFRAALAMTKDLPPEERITRIYETVGNYMEVDLFPVIAIDSKEKRPFIVERDGD